MSIRTIKPVLTISYQEQRELEAEHGSRLLTPDVRDDGQGGYYMTTPNNAKFNRPEWDALFVAVDETTHEGCVVGVETDYAVRIMSDVWADVTYAVVYTPEGDSLFTRVPIGNSEMYYYSHVKVTVDASEEALAAYEGWKRGKAYRKALNASELEDSRWMSRRREIQIGDVVRVVKGRKVPQGTEGVVFWMGNNGYGPSVGIGLPQADGTFRKVTRTGRYGKTYESYADVAWTAQSNVVKLRELGGREL